MSQTDMRYDMALVVIVVVSGLIAVLALSLSDIRSELRSQQPSFYADSDTSQSH